MSGETPTPPPEPEITESESAEAPEAVRPWQPFTPRGLAAFAQATLGRLLAVQLVVALLSAAVIGWFVCTAWFSVVDRAVRQLPATGDLVDGRLVWTNAPVILAENPFLAIGIDPAKSGKAGQTSDLQVEFGETSCLLSGVLGSVDLPYPRRGIAAFNRTELVPWWGAWQQAVLGIAIGGTIVTLFLAWALLALAYGVPAKLAARLTLRPLTWGGAWKLAAASLLPGALFQTLAIAIYTLGFFNLVHLGFCFVFHLIIGWSYLAVGLWSLPKAEVAAPEKAPNPFVGALPPTPEPPPEKKENPFA